MAGVAYALLGPTASGKSRLALELAARFSLEIVSMDSAQVYRGMDIGTAKPGAAERARVPHHLVDLVDPDQSYSAGRWRTDCIEAVTGILGRKKLPLIVGGTMLYYRALVTGLDVLPTADAGIREAINRKAKQSGWPALHAELAKVDPLAAKRITPNDAQRIQRALEVFRLSGKPLSSLQSGATQALPFELQAFALVVDRKLLHERIEARFGAMLEAGLIDEVRALKKKFRLQASTPSMRAVGYRQVWEFLDGAIDRDALARRGIAATRQLAKRQETWLRGFRGLQPAERLESAIATGSK